MENKSPFKVSIRLISGNSSLLAKADVTGAKMTINGFSVMAGKDGKPWVSEPSMKQGSGYLKIAEITDKPTRDLISKLVLEGYHKTLAERGGDDQQYDQEPAF
ncbi:MAG: hypothetical protein HQM08_30375 [Candidatus Riflebacteria bacterium]|nr:hypothetical protein [Candidatus Riflebacteria bacterium]